MMVILTAPPVAVVLLFWSSDSVKSWPRSRDIAPVVVIEKEPESGDVLLGDIRRESRRVEMELLPLASLVPLPPSSSSSSIVWRRALKSALPPVVDWPGTLLPGQSAREGVNLVYRVFSRPLHQQ